MRHKLYCVEIAQELITPYLVSAASKQEAKELVFSEHGEPGDYYFGSYRVVSVRVKRENEEQGG